MGNSTCTKWHMQTARAYCIPLQDRATIGNCHVTSCDKGVAEQHPDAFTCARLHTNPLESVTENYVQHEHTGVSNPALRFSTCRRHHMHMSDGLCLKYTSHHVDHLRSILPMSVTNLWTISPGTQTVEVPRKFKGISHINPRTRNFRATSPTKKLLLYNKVHYDCATVRESHNWTGRERMFEQSETIWLLRDNC